jgi:hypothetical protein
MNRRRFLVTTAGAGAAAMGVPWLAGAGAATDEDLAFANFGVSAELLLKDFYAKALEAKLVGGAGRSVLRRGRSASAQHAKALGALLTGAGDTPPVDEDFAFEWPAPTFKTTESIVTTGLGLLRALLGAYQTAAATATEPTYRVLYASLAASIGQQIGALATLAPRAGVESFPAALDLEAASDALDRYLG